MLPYFLFVCCLIITRIEINAAETSSTSQTEKPPLDEGEDLVKIQNELLEIQDDVIFITKAISQVENLDNIMDKFNVTQESFQLIKDKLANEIDQLVEQKCRETAMTMLDNHYDAVNTQLKNLQMNLKEFQQKRLPSDTIADIKGHRFDLAQEKLKQQNNFQDILKIVQQVYGNSSDNFDLLANLTESLTDTDLVYNSIKALQQEILKNNKVDPYKLIRLVKIMETGVINKDFVDPNTKSSALEVVNELKQSVKVFTLNALKAAADKGSFEQNGETDNLTMAVYSFDPAQSESIIEEIVQTNFEDESLKKILDTILSHRFIEQRIKGISVLLSKLKDSGKIKNDVTMDIASALYKIHSNNEFKTLNQSMQTEVEHTIDMLPICARNLFFLPSVCFWNRANEEYLTAGNSTHQNDKKRRNIFSTEDPLPGSHWNVERIDDNFLFSSRSYPNEYLYAAYFNHNPDLRYLFSWIPGNNTDKQSKWNIRLDLDYCSIQSASYYEYMISSNYKSIGDEDMNLNYVFTWSPNTQIDQHQFQWQIRKCN